MSAPRIILASLPSFCQKLSKLMEIWRSSDKNNFPQFFFETRCMVTLAAKPNVMDTLILFSLSPISWNSQTNNYSRVLSAQITVYFICLKKTSLNFTCLFDPEVIPLIYLVYQYNLTRKSFIYRNLYSNKCAVSNHLCVLHYSGDGVVNDVRLT